MKQLLLTICCLYALVACAQPTGDVVFTSVNVIPMDRETVLPNKDVLIRNGIIMSITDAGNVRYGKTTRVIDGKGKYLMPGLAEMHAHVPPIDDLEPMKEVLLLFAANGITHIRGMLGHPRHLELRDKIKTGEILGPSFYTSGPSANGNSTPTPEAAAQLAREQKAAGYDFIKIHPGIKLESFQVLSRTAKEVGISLAGHVPADVGIWNAIDLGLLTIDHLDGMVEALIPGEERFAEGAHGLFASYKFMEADSMHTAKLMETLRFKNIWIVPTQALAVRWLSPERSAAERAAEPEMAYIDKKTLTNWTNTKNNTESNAQYKKAQMPQYIALRNHLILACQKAGVPLLLGSDAPQVFNVPGFSAHHELQYMVDAGLTPYQALYSGTAAVGKFYGKKKMGTVQEGAPADLILLNNNPLTNIKHAGAIEGVMLQGKWLDRNWREKTLATIAAQKK